MRSYSRFFSHFSNLINIHMASVGGKAPTPLVSQLRLTHIYAANTPNLILLLIVPITLVSVTQTHKHTRPHSYSTGRPSTTRPTNMAHLSTLASRMSLLPTSKWFVFGRSATVNTLINDGPGPVLTLMLNSFLPQDEAPRGQRYELRIIFAMRPQGK